MLAAFVDTYGEKVLAAPTKKGFNLAAWIFPFLATFVAAVVIFLGLRKWVQRRQKQTRQHTYRLIQRRDSEYEVLLDKELEEYN